MMPFYRVNGTLVHLKLSGKRSKWPLQCCARRPEGDKCLAISDILCDWPLEEGGTCSAPLCADHAVEVGKDLHLCPLHAPRRDELEGAQKGLFDAED